MARRFEALADGGRRVPRLVGREHEQALLHTLVSAALAGHGNVALISGEAGIGKTALAEALTAQARARGVLVLTGRCYDLADTPPYGPWLDLFERLPTAGGPSPLQAISAPQSAALDVPGRAALFAHVRESVMQAATCQPLVLILDDLHWADAASLDLLRYLARQVTDLPLLLVVMYRVEEVTRRHPFYAVLPHVVQEAQANRLDMGPLEDGAIRALIAGEYQLPLAEVTRLARYLADRTEGNPFYIWELLRTLEDDGVLRPGATGWALSDLTQVPVPLLVRQVIDGRLARLGEETWHLLALAAVIGQEVSLRLWGRLGDVGEETLLDVMDRAVEAHVLEEVADSRCARFVHALVRDALYQGMSSSRRRFWHRCVAEALAATTVPDLDTVAYHFRQAGDPRAPEWLVRAAERAAGAYAWLTAAERYETALPLLKAADSPLEERGWILHRLALLRRYVATRQSLGYLDEAAWVAAAVENRPLAACVVADQGYLHCVMGEYRRGIAELTAGVRALQGLSSSERVRLRAQGVWSAETHRQGALVSFLALAGRYAEARALGEQVMGTEPGPGGMASGLGGSPAADASLGLALTYASMGRPEDARRMMARARAAYRAIDHPYLVGLTALYELIWIVLPYQTDHCAERHHLAVIAEEAWTQTRGLVNDVAPGMARLPLLLLEGGWEEAKELALSVSGANSGGLFELIGPVLGPLARAQGDVTLAWSVVADILPEGLFAEPGDAPFLSALVQQRLAAALALDAGDLVGVRAWLEAHDRWLAVSGSLLGQAEGHLLWAVYERASGHQQLAQARADVALACAQAPRQPLALLAAHRLLGQFATADGLPTKAAAHLDASLILADACALPYERALTIMALAMLRQSTGQLAEARTLARSVDATCTPLNAVPVLEQAAALAATLDRAMAAHADEAGPGYPAELTAREGEVLRLVAAGRSNRDIAALLCLSVRTVERHVGNIYGKIDAHNKADATAYAFHHHLV